ncbi:reverse transcriptase and recombinase [Plakobranchus ocellatus]|uniref:Reverse transcriptase and recombinase n=1 Tax=Plakobranchus ocellatus TaxID=259542 RepID=A0AAV3YWX4_9GAST|nr:reverse transcriptase and recombinase [Plakobranchus ocellatus]
MAAPFPLSDRASDVRPGCKTQRIAPTLRQVADLVCARIKEREYFKTCIVGHVNCCLQCAPTLNRVVELLSSSSSDHTGKRLHAALSEGEVSSPNSPAGPSKRTKITAFASEEEWGGLCDERDKQTVDLGDVELDDEEELLNFGGAGLADTDVTSKREKTIALKNNGNKWEKPMSLSLKAREKVEWWNSTIATAVSPIRRANPHVIIKTDASLRAWGAVCNQVRTGGAWLVEKQGSSKDQSRGGHRRGGCALLASTTIFSCPDETISGPPNPALRKKKPSTPSQSSRDPPSPSQETKTPCMQGVGDRLRQQGFSAKATEVMLDSWRPDTKKVYASYITKWQRYAAAIKVDSVSPPITATVNFLADLYEKGASHSVYA